MTREEAIKILEQFKKCLSDVVFDEKGSEAWQMAIKALSQEPTVTSTDEPMTMVYPTIVCDDAISREDRLVDLANAIESDDSGYWTNKRISSALRNIEKLTSFTQKSDNKYRKEAKRWKNKWLKSHKSKTGHWIMSDDGLYRPICDKCGAHPWKGYIPTVEEANEVFKYCPNCGADMRETETWNGFHGQVTAPKGTFKQIWEDADKEQTDVT